MKAVCSFLTSESDYTGTQHHIPEQNPLGYSNFFGGGCQVNVIEPRIMTGVHGYHIVQLF